MEFNTEMFLPENDVWPMDSNPDSNRASLTGQPGTKMKPGRNKFLIAGQPGRYRLTDDEYKWTSSRNGLTEGPNMSKGAISSK